MKITIKHYLQQCVSFLSVQLAVLGVWLGRHDHPNPNFLDDLSPIDNIKNAETYDQALEWAIKNKRIKNIAVTGPYGSGKSSLLKTFEKKHPGYHYLNISLASFQDEVKTEDVVPPVSGANGETEEKNRLIELSILQQMFYRVKNNKIPDSRFNRIRNLSFWRISLFSWFSVAFGIAILILFNPPFLKRMSWWGDFSKKHGDWLIYAAILLSLPAIFKVQAYILRLLNTSKFNKINLTKGEVEFDNKSETSVLNMHLDEILYFFEVTKYNVVVFEDLDRFNDPEIFTKLREINILINKSLQINRHIVFIYAIKDDMFKDKTRTKFFDFIIPVIPVINWSNSYEIMVEKFRQAELGLTVSEKFISAITLYIDDMRALKNIFNEFMLYKENLKLVAPIQDKLLAIIIYKNIFPSEFADLHENKGTIYQTFQMKSQLIQESLDGKQTLIQKNKERMAKFKEVLAEDIPALRAIYLLAFQKLAGTALKMHINNAEVSFADVQNSDSHFDWLKSQTNISAYRYVQHPSYGNASLLMSQVFNTGISFKQLEAEINPELTYDNRAQLVKNERIAEIEELDGQNQQAEKEILELQSHSLKELIEDNNELLKSLPDALLKQKLLVYLIREGYIDETYPSLISYFYEGSLTYKDMAFILNIRNRETLPFSYTLDTTKNILGRLEPTDFTRSQALNFDLVSYLIENDALYKGNLDKVMLLLADHSANSLAFIEEYIKEGKLLDKFLNRLFTAWPEFWDYIDDDPTYVAERKNMYLRLILSYATTPHLKKLNESKKLEKYLKNLPGILNWFTEEKEIGKFKKIIELFNLKFHKLDAPQLPTLLDYIIEHRNYMLTEDMIRLIIQQKGSEVSKDEELISTANYTAVQVSGFQPLIAYVTDNLSDYIESVTLLLERNTKDNEEQVMTLLNNDVLAIDIREKLINKEDIIIKDVKTIPKELWNSLLIANKMLVNWPNIFAFYELENELSESLIAYLNKIPVYEQLSKSRSNIGTLESLHEQFDKALLSENRLTDQAYGYLVKSSGYFYPSNGLTIDGLSDKKVATLLNHRKLRLDTATFEKIKSQFPGQLGTLIEKNIDDYLKSPASYPLEAAEFIQLFRSSVPVIQKTALIPLITDDLFEGSAELSGLISGHLLQHDSTAPTSATLQILMRHGNLLTRRQLLDKFFRIFTKEELGPILLFMGNDFKLIAPDGSSFVIEADEMNISLAKKIKHAGLIADWKNKKNELTLFMNKKE